MRTSRWRRSTGLLLGIVAVLAIGSYATWRCLGRVAPTVLPSLHGPAYETWARNQFQELHPGEKPLNWEIATAAVRLYRTQPMGKFVLGVTPGVWGNDCSDFVDCAIDEGLGVGARFTRHSNEHLIGEDAPCFRTFYWDGEATLQPGDLLSVRHSPWYDPTDASCWHVGVIGTDGMVYDFVKLRRWDSARYGRHPVDWFVQHSRPERREVLITRLRPEYRYRITPIEVVPKPPLRMPAGEGLNAQHPAPEGN